MAPETDDITKKLFVLTQKVFALRDNVREKKGLAEEINKLWKIHDIEPENRVALPALLWEIENYLSRAKWKAAIRRERDKRINAGAWTRNDAVSLWYELVDLLGRSDGTLYAALRLGLSREQMLRLIRKHLTP